MIALFVVSNVALVLAIGWGTYWHRWWATGFFLLLLVATHVPLHLGAYTT